MTRVLVVDDHAIVRFGVRRLLEDVDGVEVVAEAGDAAEALAYARRDPPGIVVLDLSLPGTTALDSIVELCALGARVVAFSPYDDPGSARTALERGALGFVRKDAGEQTLVEAVCAVANDHLYVDPQVAARLVPRAEHDDDDLTVREREVLRMLALGHTNQEIGSRLFVSVRTVEAHRRRILEKLRLDTRAELVRYAIDHQMVGFGT